MAGRGGLSKTRSDVQRQRFYYDCNLRSAAVPPNILDHVCHKEMVVGLGGIRTGATELILVKSRVMTGESLVARRVDRLAMCDTIGRSYRMEWRSSWSVASNSV